MYTLYIANKNYSSWSLRPWSVMSQLGIPFEEKLVPFEQGCNWDSFRAFSPTGKVPCLLDGDRVVWDSLAIVEYLAERHDGVWPSDPDARAWARCAAAEMHSGFGALREQASMNCGVRVRLHHLTDALKSDIARIDELWNEGLVRFGGPFLAGGHFSAVDAFFVPVAFRILTYDLPVQASTAALAEQLRQLPSSQRWYQDALRETWRDSAHDDEAHLAGEWLEDLRAR
ncbi:MULTISPECIES: glutathione S-transferase family protein [Dyella]|uniref:Glutathione S-transferase family protein n=2 Tax=Dyella TaxID=231454 RepID=A0A4R0YPL4_9GAMM|nr:MULTISPECIES: glutathione S-transferase family protein [Dyella]TBR36592.1 glutathione S-transferase family protein [Dyella terrae]TCI08316.1 glutathione S-transferase family protein [Dyella soli]